MPQDPSNYDPKIRSRGPSLKSLEGLRKLSWEGELPSLPTLPQQGPFPGITVPSEGFLPEPQTASSAIEGLQTAKPTVPSPSEAASTLGPSGFTSDVSNLQGMRETRLREMQRNRELAAGSGGLMGTGATASDVSALQEDIAKDPYTGEAERGRIGAINVENLKSLLGGYGSPQEAARAEREVEAAKIQAPVEAQRVAGELDIRRQQEASKGALDVAKEYTQRNPLAGMLGGGQLPPGASVSTSRYGGSYRSPAEQQVPPTIIKELADAREDARRAGAPWLVGTTPEGERLSQALASYMSSSPAPAEYKDFVMEALRKYGNTNISLQQILESEGEDTLTPDEYGQIQDLWLAIKGSF